MTKLFLLFSVILLSTTIIVAQNTQVTATVHDPAGENYSNGTYSITFIPTPGSPGPFTVNGASFNKGPINGTIDNTGTFQVLLTDNTKIQPGGSSWLFQICPNATSPCTTYRGAVSGLLLNISAPVNAVVPLIRTNATIINKAYQDSEVVPFYGAMYFNTTTFTMSCSLDGVTFSACGSGGGGGTTNPAPQYFMPYYSTSGTSNFLSGSNILLDSDLNSINVPTAVKIGNPSNALVNSLGSLNGSAFQEAAGPGTPTAGVDYCYASSIRHGYMCSYNGGGEFFVGNFVSDPGSNGIMFRNALNTTRASIFGDVVNMWASGSCVGFLKNDGTCTTNSTANPTVIYVNASFTINTTDFNSRVYAMNTSGLTVQLPLIAPANGMSITVIGNYDYTNGGQATIKAQGSMLLDGNAGGSIFLYNNQSVRIWSDGTGYRTDNGGMRIAADVPGTLLVSGPLGYAKEFLNNAWTQDTFGNINAVEQFNNNTAMLQMQRFTDSLPTGWYLRGVNAAATPLEIWSIGLNGAIKTSNLIGDSNDANAFLAFASYIPGYGLYSIFEGGATTAGMFYIRATHQFKWVGKTGATLFSIDHFDDDINTPNIVLGGTAQINKRLTVFAGGCGGCHLKGTTESIGGSLLTAGSCTFGNVTVTGANVGDPVAVSNSTGALTSGNATLTATVAISNIVTVNLCAINTFTPISTTYNVAVIQ